MFALKRIWKRRKWNSQNAKHMDDERLYWRCARWNQLETIHHGLVLLFVFFLFRPSIDILYASCLPLATCFCVSNRMLNALMPCLCRSTFCFDCNSCAYFVKTERDWAKTLLIEIVAIQLFVRLLCSLSFLFNTHKINPKKTREILGTCVGALFFCRTYAIRCHIFFFVCCIVFFERYTIRSSANLSLSFRFYVNGFYSAYFRWLIWVFVFSATFCDRIYCWCWNDTIHFVEHWKATEWMKPSSNGTNCTQSRRLTSFLYFLNKRK